MVFEGEQQGAEIVPFSPLEDSHLPPALSGLYLAGGFSAIVPPWAAGADSLPVTRAVGVCIDCN